MLPFRARGDHLFDRRDALVVRIGFEAPPGEGLEHFPLSARLPAVYGFREHVDAGGLISYGVNLADIFRRAATYV